MTETVLWMKDRCHGFEAWCSCLSKGWHPFRERGRLKTGGRTSLMRWCIRSQQTFPCMKWWTNVGSHASYTTTDSSSLCQRLTFPCVWVSAKYRTDVPAPPQLSSLPRGVIVRLCHKKIVVWWSPSIRPVRLPRVDQWEVMTSPVDICQSIHQGWVKTSGNV